MDNAYQDYKALDLSLKTGEISFPEIADIIETDNIQLKKFFAGYKNLPIFLLRKLCLDNNKEVAMKAIKNSSLQEEDLVEIMSDPKFKLDPEVILTNPNMKDKEFIDLNIVPINSSNDENDVRDNDGEYPEAGETLISQGSKKKFTLKQIKSMSPNSLLKLINKAKNFLKKDKTWKDVCKEYDQDPDIIDLIPTTFGVLPVSAKTDHGTVIINYKLLLDGDFFKDYSYLIHEYTHWFQQCFGEKPTTGSNKGSYLDNKYEQEGFQNQLKYIADHFGDQEADNYVENLFEHHDIKNKSKQDELESVLLDKVE